MSYRPSPIGISNDDRMLAMCGAVVDIRPEPATRRSDALTNAQAIRDARSGELHTGVQRMTTGSH